MAFMQPMIDGPITVVELENEFGETEYNYPDTYGETDLADNNLTVVAEHKEKFLAYLSAPGYMDRTDYTMVDSEEEGRQYLVDTYDLCKQCLGEQIDWVCHDCVKSIKGAEQLEFETVHSIGELIKEGVELEQIAKALDEAGVMQHGVEGFSLGEYGRPNESVDYINMGDSYDATVVLFENETIVTSWGGLLEEIQMQHEKEVAAEE